MSLIPGIDNEIISQHKKSSSSKTGYILIGLTGGVGLALSIISIPFVSPALRRVCLPYVPATNQQITNVLKALSGRSGSVLDLGSGDGRLVMETAKNGFKSIGVELNLWLVIFSKLSAYFQGLSPPKTQFIKQDLWTINLATYDNVIIFGVEQMMNELENKFKDELKDNCQVIACRFPLPSLTPVKIIGQGVDTVWVYKFPPSSSLNKNK